MSTTNDRLVSALVFDCKLRDKLGNPLLQAWQHNDPLSNHPDTAHLAWLLSGTFASAIPNDQALDAIAAHGPVVEIGAGTGYWARLLADRGVDVVAYDRHPHACSCGTHPRWCGRSLQEWFPVRLAPAEVAALHPDRTLLIIWPPPNDPMAATGLEAHRLAGGRIVARVDDGAYGCSADDTYYQMLEPPACGQDERAGQLYHEIELIDLPPNYGGTDRLWIYESTATD
jgi:hypothetical protein